MLKDKDSNIFKATNKLESSNLKIQIFNLNSGTFKKYTNTFIKEKFKI